MKKIVEIKICKQCNIEFKITNKDLEFYKKISPKFGWKVFEIPTPSLCQNCRQQLRLSFRNERNLYKRKCDATWEEIISIYSPDKPYNVYKQDYWWSDKWDGLDYWRGYDFEKWFFQQFQELMLDVPKISLNWFWNENCDYTNFLWNSKSCYFTIAWVENQDVLILQMNNHFLR